MNLTHGGSEPGWKSSAEETVPSRPSEETAAQAIAALDAQFPWLRGVEKRRRPGQRSVPRPTQH